MDEEDAETVVSADLAPQLATKTYSASVAGTSVSRGAMAAPWMMRPAMSTGYEGLAAHQIAEMKRKKAAMRSSGQVV